MDSRILNEYDAEMLLNFFNDIKDNGVCYINSKTNFTQINKVHIVREMLFKSQILAVANIKHNEIKEILIVVLPLPSSRGMFATISLFKGNKFFFKTALHRILTITNDLDIYKIKAVVNEIQDHEIVKLVNNEEFIREVSYIHNGVEYSTYAKFKGD